MIRLDKSLNNATLEHGRDTDEWYGLNVLNTGGVIFNDTVFIYYRGPVGTYEPSHSIGVITAPVSDFNGKVNWNYHKDINPILSPSDLSLGDAKLANVSAAVYDGYVYLYFNVKDTGPYRCAVARSSDGFNFTDLGNCLTPSSATFGGGGCGVVDVDGTLVMMHGVPTGRETSCRTSTDGVVWDNFALAIDDSPIAGSCDEYSRVTQRLIYEDPYIYAFIGGSPEFEDWPEAFILYRAHKANLQSWERYSQNPVFLRGSAGTWDEGALWSPTVLKVNNEWYMFYEGAGSDSAGGSSNSNGARDDDYYQYSSTNFSRIGLAKDNSLKTLTERWSDPGMEGDYYVRSLQTGLYLGEAEV